MKPAKLVISASLALGVLLSNAHGADYFQGVILGGGKLTNRQVAYYQDQKRISEIEVGSCISGPCLKHRVKWRKFDRRMSKHTHVRVRVNRRLHRKSHRQNHHNHTHSWTR